MVSEHEVDPLIEDIAGELRRPVRFDSTFESRVMAAIEPGSASLPVDEAPSTPWLLRPRILYVSPLAGFAVAAGIVGIVTMSVLRTQPERSLAQDSIAVPPNTSGAPTVVVANSPDESVAYATFTFVQRGARAVSVVGSFNDWDAEKTRLEQINDSVWTANIPLIPGRYEYQLVVDGKWMPDPGAQRSSESDFGGSNSVIIVSPLPR